MTRLPQSIGDFYPDGFSAQLPSVVSVVMPTVLRPCIAQAVQSVFQQSLRDRIQLVIGVDKAAGGDEALRATLDQRPDNVSAIVLALPFSTSVRHGGVHPALDGGALRAILSFVGNSQYVAFLDDDNTWAPEHLALVLEAIKGKVWAYAQRQLVEEATGKLLGVDIWDSVGPNAGRFAKQGGFVDPNCLLVDKVAAARAFGRWSAGPGLFSDRSFFAAIKDAPHGRVDQATVRYGIRPSSIFYTFLRESPKF